MRDHGSATVYVFVKYHSKPGDKEEDHKVI